MKKILYIILGFIICQSSFSQEKEVIFLDAEFNNVNEKNKKGDLVIRIGKSISQKKTRSIYYYVEFERDMNGEVVNEVKLYRAKRKLLEVDPRTANTKMYHGRYFIETIAFYTPEGREGTIAGRGFVSKIDTDNFTNSIFKGQWREFYLNGNLKKVIPYDANGIYEEYFEDGELKKKINYVNGEIINEEYNIDINNNLKYFSDENYIKAYIEKDGIDELEGLYECSAHIPIRGRNLRGTYKIAIVSSKKSFSIFPSNYTAYILEAHCKDCLEWEKGDILALFKKRESGEYDIYWNHPMTGKNQLVVYPDYGAKNFGSVDYAQIFITEAIVESNKRIVFSITSEFIQHLGVKKISSDESVILDRIWPKSDIDTSIFSNQENDSSKDNMTREEAIVLLKELKELLDLGLITEEEFVKQSEELKNKIFIKN